jgi:hypothetical protein
MAKAGAPTAASKPKRDKSQHKTDKLEKLAAAPAAPPTSRVLLDDILALGGDEADLALLEDVDVDGEDEVMGDAAMDVRWRTPSRLVARSVKTRPSSVKSSSRS